jgi:hypothetical protein
MTRLITPYYAGPTWTFLGAAPAYAIWMSFWPYFEQTRVGIGPIAASHGCTSFTSAPYPSTALRWSEQGYQMPKVFESDSRKFRLDGVNG